MATDLMVARSRRRGFALITSLAAVVLALMLLGAFFSANRSYLTLSRLNDDKRACQDASLALADYCRYRFEKDKTWAKLPCQARSYEIRDRLSRVIFALTEIATDQLDQHPELLALEGQSHVIGQMGDNGVTFHLAITNNFNGDAAVDGVGEKSCRLVIEAQRGSARETVEVTYRSAAFFDASLAASKDVTISVGSGENDHLVLQSRDPVHNELRSLSNVLLPGADDIKFRPDEDNTAAVRGTVWAQQKIRVGDSDEQAHLERAAIQTRGQFIANGKTQYAIPDLTLEQARMSGADLPRVDLRCGVYYFKEAAVSFEVGGAPMTEIIPTFQRFEPLDQGQGPLTDFDFLTGDLPAGVDLDSVRLAGQPWADAHPHGSDDFRVADGPKVSFYDEGNFKPTAILPTGRNLVVQSEVIGSRTVPGDLKIKGAGDLVPQVLFQGEDDASQRVCLSVERDLVVEGKILGGGKLIAGRDVHLQANKVVVSTDERDDIAVYAGNNVRIYPGANEGTDGSDNGDAEGKFSFRGLVYASNDFTFQSMYTKEHEDGSEEEFEYAVDLEINGAVVARNGRALIESKKGVKLIYNPKFLDDFLEDEFFQNRLQVEELAWRPR